MSHHFSYYIKKRGHKKNSKYLSFHCNIIMLDKVCAVFSIVMPMTAVPQIWKLYSLQDASGLSIWMWILYCVGVIPFLLYGIVHRFTSLIILNTLWLIVQFVMIIGIFMYM